MTRPSRILLLAALVALAAAALPASAPAATKLKVAVGIGDQSPRTFDHPAFKALKIKRVRYFIPWNAALPGQEHQLARADQYVMAARAAKLRVLLHIHTDDLRPKKAKLPSVKQYRKAVGALVKRYKPLGVKDWGVWNEANHKTQPTWPKIKGAKRAAQFFLAMRKMCKRCSIVALDVLDQRGVETYMKNFYKALGKRKRLATVVGIHNYSSSNRFKTKPTVSIIRTARKHNRRSKFWLTETGGVAAFRARTPGKKDPLPFDLTRQAKAIDFMFKLIKRYRRQGIQRLYSYNWWAAPADQAFDAGLVNIDGSTRPAYDAFRKHAKRFTR